MRIAANLIMCARYTTSLSLSGLRDSKANPLLTLMTSNLRLSSTLRDYNGLARDHPVYVHSHGSTGIVHDSRTHPDASSADAITGLSYPGTHRACARWCRRIQVSPQRPDALLRPHQPTCRGQVQPSRAALAGDFHPLQ